MENCMRKILLGVVFIAFLPTFGQRTNIFLSRDFWTQNTTVDQVKAEIAKGNSPSELNERAFDAPTLAILGKVPTATAIYLIEQPGNSITKATHDGRTYLFWAASAGNVELMHYLIQKGSDLYAKDTKGNIPITFAALFGVTNPKVYDVFFKAGISPKTKYDQGETLLMKVIPFDNERLELTQYFLGKGMKIKEVSNSGATLFDYAAKGGNIHLLKVLRKKVKPTYQALPMAAEGMVRQPNNPIELYKYLVENQKISANAFDSKGANALHYLSRRQDLPSIKYLIGKGAMIDIIDKNGNTALMNACYGRNLDIVRALYKSKGHINQANKKGETALLIALQRSDNNIVNFLLEQGADTRVISKKGTNVIEALLDSYNPRKKDNEIDFDKKVTLLKQYLVSLQAPNTEGDTPLHLAVVKGNKELLEKVLSFGGDINSQNKDGETPLIKAAMVAKDTTILEYLVTHGADKGLTTSLGETAYELAKENENLQKSEADLSFLR